MDRAEGPKGLLVQNKMMEESIDQEKHTDLNWIIAITFDSHAVILF